MSIGIECGAPAVQPLPSGHGKLLEKGLPAGVSSLEFETLGLRGQSATQSPDVHEVLVQTEHAVGTVHLKVLTEMPPAYGSVCINDALQGHYLQSTSNAIASPSKAKLGCCKIKLHLYERRQHHPTRKKEAPCQ